MHFTTVGSIPAILIYTDTQPICSSPFHSLDDCSAPMNGTPTPGLALGFCSKGLQSEHRQCPSIGSRGLHPLEIKNLAPRVLAIGNLVMLVQFVFCNGRTSDIEAHLVNGPV